AIPGRCESADIVCTFHGDDSLQREGRRANLAGLSGNSIARAREAARRPFTMERLLDRGLQFVKQYSHKLCSRFDFQLLKDPSKCPFYRINTDTKHIGNLEICQSLCHEQTNLDLSCCKRAAQMIKCQWKTMYTRELH